MCEICGRSSCTRSFHSLSEQEEFDTKTGRYAPEPDMELPGMWEKSDLIGGETDMPN